MNFVERLEKIIPTEEFLLRAKRKLKEFRKSGLKEEANYLRLRIETVTLISLSLKIMIDLLRNCKIMNSHKDLEQFMRMVEKAKRQMSILVD